MRIVRRTGSMPDNCVNECRGAVGTFSEAVYDAVFLGMYRVPLCRPCAREWREAWASAVPQPDAEPAAVEAIA